MKAPVLLLNTQYLFDFLLFLQEFSSRLYFILHFPSQSIFSFPLILQHRLPSCFILLPFCLPYPTAVAALSCLPPLCDIQLLFPALFLLIDGVLNVATYNEAKKPGITCHSLHPYRVNINAHLTYMGSCILIYFYIKTNHMHNFSIYFGIVNSTCFGRSLRPSSGVLSLYIQHQVYVMQILVSACSESINA